MSVEKLMSLINSRSEDEQIDLVALTGLGGMISPPPTGRLSQTMSARPNVFSERQSLATSWRKRRLKHSD